MKAYKLIPALLVVFLVLHDMALIRALELGDSAWPKWPGVVGVGLAFGQVALVAAWLVWGRVNLAFRIIVSLAVLYLLSSTAAACTVTSSGNMYGVVLFDCAFTLLGFALFRIMGISISRESSDSFTETAAETKTAVWQFSIWGILSAMTGVGCVLGALQLAEMPGTIVFAFLGVAIQSCLTFLVAFSSLRWWLVVAILLASSVANSWLLALTSLAAFDTGRTMLFMAMSLALGSTLAIAAAVLRISGYRMNHRRGS